MLISSKRDKISYIVDLAARGVENHGVAIMTTHGAPELNTKGEINHPPAESRLYSNNSRQRLHFGHLS
jgi:hypothetical protein